MIIKQVDFHAYIHPVGLSATEKLWNIKIEGDVVTLKNDTYTIITPWGNVKSAQVKEVMDDKPKESDQERTTPRTTKKKAVRKTVAKEKL